MYYTYSNSNELTHYGILGQKWGIRRYQNPDGTLTEAGKKRYGSVENFEAGRTKKQAAKYEKAKQEAITSGNAEKVQKFSKELTPEEMSRALQRINDEQKLSELRQKDVALGMTKAQTIIDAGGKVKAAAQTVTDLYNIGAKAYNAFNKKGKELPIIGESRKKTNPAEKFTQFNLEREKKRWEWEQEKHAAESKKSDSSSNSNGSTTDAGKDKNYNTYSPHYDDKSAQYHYSTKGRETARTVVNNSGSKSVKVLPSHEDYVSDRLEEEMRNIKFNY